MYKGTYNDHISRSIFLLGVPFTHTTRARLGPIVRGIHRSNVERKEDDQHNFGQHRKVSKVRNRVKDWRGNVKIKKKKDKEASSTRKKERKKESSSTRCESEGRPGEQGF